MSIHGCEHLTEAGIEECMEEDALERHCRPLRLRLETDSFSIGLQEVTNDEVDRLDKHSS